jgi:hypothetical protein
MKQTVLRFSFVLVAVCAAHQSALANPVPSGKEATDRICEVSARALLALTRARTLQLDNPSVEPRLRIAYER